MKRGMRDGRPNVADGATAREPWHYLNTRLAALDNPGDVIGDGLPKPRWKVVTHALDQNELRARNRRGRCPAAADVAQRSLSPWMTSVGTSSGWRQRVRSPDATLATA